MLSRWVGILLRNDTGEGEIQLPLMAASWDDEHRVAGRLTSGHCGDAGGVDQPANEDLLGWHDATFGRDSTEYHADHPPRFLRSR